MTLTKTNRILVAAFVALVIGAPARTQGPQPARSQVSFKPTASGEVLIHGVHFGFTVYTAQNGETAVGKDTRFNTPTDAESYLRERLSDAKNVKTHTNQRDAAGSSIGERAQGLFPNENRRPVTGILWTRGSQYYEVSSTSQKTARALEVFYRSKLEHTPK